MQFDAASVRRAAAFVAATFTLGLAGTASLSTLVTLPRRARVEIVTPATTPPPNASADAPQSLPRGAAALREVLAARTRLGPDRRALMALSELQRLTDGTVAPARAEWRDARWRLSLGGADAGTLPEHPDFETIVALVTEVASGMTPLHPLAPAGDVASAAASWPLASASRPAFAALSALDVAWASGQRNAETLAAAARALASLSLETPDALDAADLLAARALAALAWSRSVGRRDLEAEVLLARHMGYEGAAARAAAELPPTSPVRAWATRDDDALRAMTVRGEARETARYLWFRRLVERREPEAARAWADHELGETGSNVAVEGFALDAMRGAPIEALRGAARGHAQRALTRLEREVNASASTARVTELLPRLVELSARRAARGTFVDESLAAARDRSVVLSALYDELSVALDAGAASEAAQLADGVSTLAPASLRDFALWATHAAYARAGTLAPDVLQQDLASPLSPGTAPLLRAAEVVLRGYERGELRARTTVERLAAHLDARPSHRAALAMIAGDALHDPTLAEAWCAPTLRDRPASEAAAWCLARRSDRASLQDMARDASLPVALRASALDLSATVRGEAEPLDGAWSALIASAPLAWAPREGYGRRLASDGRTDAAMALVESWIRAARDAPPSLVARARTEAARIARARGEPQRALHLVEPALSTLDEPLLGEAARALADLGRFDDAERVAVASLDHHRSEAAVALAAEVYWRRNAYDRAARVVAQSGVAIGADAWRARVVEAFARVFNDAMPAAARAAVGELSSAALPLARLRAIPRELHRRGRSDLATVTLDALVAAQHARAPEGDADAAVEGYLFRAPSGREVAAAWASARFDHVDAAIAATAAFSRGADVLLWGTIEPPREREGAERVWLLRAAARLRASDREAHREALEEHYAIASGDTSALGRALARGALMAPLLTAARAPRQRVETAYFAGLQAQSQGRVREALDWYLMTALVGADGDPEVAWASAARDALYDRALPLDALGAHPWSGAEQTRSTEAPVEIDAAQETAGEAPSAPRTGGHHRHHHGRRRPRRDAP